MVMVIGILDLEVDIHLGIKVVTDMLPLEIRGRIEHHVVETTLQLHTFQVICASIALGRASRDLDTVF